jgi:hypothetical protein
MKTTFITCIFVLLCFAVSCNNLDKATDNLTEQPDLTITGEDPIIVEDPIVVEEITPEEAPPLNVYDCLETLPFVLAYHKYSGNPNLSAFVIKAIIVKEDAWNNGTHSGVQIQPVETLAGNFSNTKQLIFWGAGVDESGTNPAKYAVRDTVIVLASEYEWQESVYYAAPGCAICFLKFSQGKVIGNVLHPYKGDEIFSFEDFMTELHKQ